MKKFKRYNYIGKKKYVVIDKPYDEVLEQLSKAVYDRDTDRPIIGIKMKKYDIFKFFLKVSKKKGDVYENYCLISEITEVDENSTKIEYSLAFDRAIFIYTKILSALCFLLPIGVGGYLLLGSNSFAISDFWYIYAALALVALFGLFAVFAFNEKKRSVIPAVKAFEKLIVECFDDGADDNEQAENDDDVTIYGNENAKEETEAEAKEEFEVENNEEFNKQYDLFSSDDDE